MTFIRINNILLFFVLLLLQACDTFKPTTITPTTPVKITTTVTPITPKPIVSKLDTVKSIPVILQPITKMDSSNTSSLLTNILQQYPNYFEQLLLEKNTKNIQIIYTQIDRSANGSVNLKNHYYHVNSEKYFYPASTVKLPICILALQKLHELQQYGIDMNTTMLTKTAFSGQTAVYNDPTTTDGKPTIANYIKKILLVSDNDAFNRLYEFLGQQYINEQLHSKGYNSAEIIHRLQISLTEEENRHTNPIQFLGPNNNLLVELPAQVSNLQYAKRKDTLGKGYYQDGKLVNDPMDFSEKNRLCLEDLHNILSSIIFPKNYTAKQRFDISDDDRKFLLQYMSTLPTESNIPAYIDDSVTYYPAYCKFLLWGAERNIASKNIRIFNKVGDAYGQVIDAAYIVDFEKKIEFIVSATIYCNEDGILNDDKYEYDTVGYPFMKNIGQAIYNYELKRERKYLPDLTEFMFTNDKKR
jgi:beta-lactamase class A